MLANYRYGSQGQLLFEIYGPLRQNVLHNLVKSLTKITANFFQSSKLSNIFFHAFLTGQAWQFLHKSGRKKRPEDHFNQNWA